ncbi:S8 family serine peptidase [Mangrovibacterium sp.]|uniref:S8 family serine peptidase n=1 Tax=Mangrovibacterium sp. TaxID=1961364 RepID=UPI003569AFB2
MNIRLLPKILLLVATLLWAEKGQSQSTQNYYWVAFDGKSASTFSVGQPEAFLSQRAIDRRVRQGIAIDERDLPVPAVYVDSLKSLGALVVHQSKWLNGATIQADQELAASISELEFVSLVELTKPGMSLKSTRQKWADEQVTEQIDTARYGSSVYQVGQLNGQYLHNQNIKGEGMQIAVLDAGFYKVNEYSAFTGLFAGGRLLGERDFVSPGNDVYQEHSHGLSVLSTMAANLPGTLIGTAPEASYYLFRTEDASTEYLIEEDNWVAAAEYADSLGVDLINSSLGYYEFDNSSMNHSYSDMDGATTRISRAADIAVQKGMLVFTSAGNEANDSWRYLIAPSDGEFVIGVGAVNSKGVWAPFSSLGPSADGRVKPNVVAMGWGTSLIRSDGSAGVSNGTSFSSPVLAGLAACLWQANPNATALQIKKAIEQSASQYAAPDSLLGYGIPDFERADWYLKSLFVDSDAEWTAYPNPFQSKIYLSKLSDFQSELLEVTVVNIAGMVVSKENITAANPLVLTNLATLPRGLYLLHLRCGSEQATVKVVKSDR